MEELEKPKYYTDSSIEIEDQTIEALTSEVTGFTLVALKDEEGNVGLYIYKDGKYEKYVEVINELVTLIPKETNSLMPGYEHTKEIDIKGNKVTVYYNDGESDFVLLYAMNVGNGENAWYLYDIKEGTLQRYSGETKIERKGKNDYYYLAIAFAIVSALSLIIIFAILGLNNRLKKKNDRLVRRLREKKVKVLDHPVFDLEVDSWKNVKTDDEELSDTDFFARPDDTMTKINTDVEIKGDAFDSEEEQVVEEKKKRKRREKRKTKEDKEAEEAELKAMRDDFLKTREIEITKEMRAVDKTKETKKRGRKKKK